MQARAWSPAMATGCCPGPRVDLRRLPGWHLGAHHVDGRCSQGTEGPEQATTAVEATLRTFLDAEKIKKINTIGSAHDRMATGLDRTAAAGNGLVPLAAALAYRALKDALMEDRAAI